MLLVVKRRKEACAWLLTRGLPTRAVRADEWGYSDAAIRATPERINARQLLVTAHGITNPTVGDWRANAVDEVTGDHLFDLVVLAVWRELTTDVLWAT